VSGAEPARPARPPWDFDYLPIPAPLAVDEPEPCDVVVATREAVPIDQLARAAADAAPGATIEALWTTPPLAWYRLRSRAIVRRAEIEEALWERGVPVRYVASARAGDLSAHPLDLRGASPPEPAEWRVRAATRGDEPATRGRWYLGAREGGIDVDRTICGTGAGTRLAVIDNDAADAEWLDLDAEVLVGVARPPRWQLHGTLMVAWAVGCPGGGGAAAFRGVAPDASPRLYQIPKPGDDVVSLPLAIVRAAFDGADVIMCATYVEGTMSPMLGDALEVARRLGRRGRGAAVVMPTGREASSPPGSVHSSWSLSLGDPASDPRVFCVGPSAYGDGWFMYADGRNKLRPFANRGPAVRWLAPGDDMALPFSEPERLFHAESSGAAAIAAGALLLVLGTSPRLGVDELEAIVSRTARRLPPEHRPARAPLADPSDVLPSGVDRDGHNAKHGYGRIDARAACLAAADPLAAALLAIGEAGAALAYARARCADPAVRAAYSPALGRWAARALLFDEAGSHALRALARHVRLVERDVARAQPKGALARALSLVLQHLAASRCRRSRRVADELERLLGTVSACPAEVEAAALDVGRRTFEDGRGEENVTRKTGP
jgi:hypothetical protein